jgi:hypothetical protein
MSNKILFGFHAVTVRLKTAPKSILEIHVDASRRDQRMRQFVERATEAGARLVDSDDDRLQKMCGTHRHQGVVARVEAMAMSHSLDDTLDAVEEVPLLLVLDGITDPHNLGACLRVADGAGAHAVIAPKDHAVGINATVSKVASGAADTKLRQPGQADHHVREHDCPPRGECRAASRRPVRPRSSGPRGTCPPPPPVTALLQAGAMPRRSCATAAGPPLARSVRASTPCRSVVDMTTRP